MTTTLASRDRWFIGLGWRHLAVSFLLIFSATACTDTDEPSVSKAKPGPVPPAPQRPGDPQAGYKVLVNGSYMNCGMPYEAWKRAARLPESIPKLEGRKGPNADMPYYLTRHENAQGQELVSNNCLSCHADVFKGEVIIGMGNESLDFTDDPRQLVNRIGTYVSSEKAKVAWRKWAKHINAIAPYMTTNTVGVNPAPNLTLALIAHRDPKTLEWSQEPRIQPPPEKPLPISVPPWWRMGKKNAMFYNAMGRGDHARLMMMESLTCTGNVEKAEKIDEAFTDVRAYIASLEAPDYPFEIDQGLAERGESMFKRHCARCHGTYGQDGQYPNLVVSLDTVGTDPTYAQKAYKDAERFMEWFNRSWYGQMSNARPALGYIAPPLDGVWATAPFLHNGSVPTLTALLDSEQRPTYWTRDFDSPTFDQSAVGWKYTTLEHGKEGASNRSERERIYDTTLPGYSNAGHTFGDPLTEAQRQAVIEYLKTL